MEPKKLSRISVCLIFFILVVNLLAIKFHWYYSIWWFDMPMHFLGGLWIGLGFFYFFPLKNLSFSLVFKVLLTVLFVGIGWEIFEILFYNIIAHNSFDILDTVSDLCFDLAGGFFAIFCFFMYNCVNAKYS